MFRRSGNSLFKKGEAFLLNGNMKKCAMGYANLFSTRGSNAVRYLFNIESGFIGFIFEGLASFVVLVR